MLTDLGVARVLGETAAARSPRPTSTPPSPGAARPDRRPTSSAWPPPRSTRSPASRRGTPPPRPTRSRSRPPASCPTSPSWRRMPRPSCSPSSHAGCRPTRTTGVRGAFALDLRHACRPEPVRLPVVGVPDAELGRTGRGAAHRAHPPGARAAAPAGTGRRSTSGRRDALSDAARAAGGRRPSRRAAALAVLAGVLGRGRAWPVRLWAPDADGADAARRRRRRHVGRSCGPPLPASPTSRRSRPPAEDWRRRGRGSSTTGGRTRSRPAMLADCSTPSTRRAARCCAADADARAGAGRDRARRCAASRPTVVEVAAGAVDGDRVELDAGRPLARLRGGGGGRRRAAHRGRPSRVRRPHGAACGRGDGWRIESAERRGLRRHGRGERRPQCLGEVGAGELVAGLQQPGRQGPLAADDARSAELAAAPAFSANAGNAQHRGPVQRPGRARG